VAAGATLVGAGDAEEAAEGAGSLIRGRSCDPRDTLPKRKKQSHGVSTSALVCHGGGEEHEKKARVRRLRTPESVVRRTP
jgi:hypothetical protein